MRLTGWTLLVAVALGGCALKGDVARVENQLTAFTAEAARQDSIRAVQLREVIVLQQQMMDSIGGMQQVVRGLRGDVANDLYNVQQQLVQLQELTGQSQRRLSELRTQLDTRGEQLSADTGRAAGPPRAPSADQMYEASLQQLRRGSPTTARAGLRQLLEAHPQHERVPDAIFYIGESFSAESPDSASSYYDQVVRNYPDSPRAPSALYKLGILAEQRQDTAAARDAFQRVVQRYPQSDEAALARERLKALGR